MIEIGCLLLHVWVKNLTGRRDPISCSWFNLLSSTSHLKKKYFFRWKMSPWNDRIISEPTKRNEQSHQSHQSHQSPLGSPPTVCQVSHPGSLRFWYRNPNRKTVTFTFQVSPSWTRGAESIRPNAVSPPPVKTDSDGLEKGPPRVSELLVKLLSKNPKKWLRMFRNHPPKNFRETTFWQP